MINSDDTWSYEEEGVLQIPDREEPFRHTDRNTLRRTAYPTPNPLARITNADGSLGIGDLRSETGRFP